MKNLAPYIAGGSAVLLAVIPPINFSINFSNEYWPWFVLVSGFFGFLLMFLRLSVWIKILSVYGFISCFFSSSPIHSFNAYMSMVICCYFFLLCTHIKNYRPVFNMFQTLLVFNTFLLCMQLNGKDPLLNFDGALRAYGAVGQHMQMGSFSVILSSALIIFNPLNILFPFMVSAMTKSAGAFLSALVGLVFCLPSKFNKKKAIAALLVLFGIFCYWMIASNKLNHNFANHGRLGVWFKSAELIFDKTYWLSGYGLGMYKHLFPALSQLPTLQWVTAHNCWVQILFELGIPGLAFAVSYFCYLFINLWKLLRRTIYRNKALACLAGLSMIGTNMMIHFPTRMIQCVLIIVFFVAYCESLISLSKECKHGG